MSNREVRTVVASLGATPTASADLGAVATRLRELHAILTAIDQGDLLATLPADPEARMLHQSAVSLLQIMGRELTQLIGDVDADASR